MNLIFNSEKKISLFILTSAVIIAGILVFYNPQAPKKSLADLQKEGSANAEGFSIEKENKQLGIISGDDLSALLTGRKPNENLTQRFADNLANGFVQANPSGVSNDGTIVTPDSEVMLSQMLKDYSSELNWQDKYVQIKELNISNNNSRESIVNYFSQLSDITFKYGDKMQEVFYSLQYFAEEANEGYIKNIVNYYGQLIGELKKLSVPSNWLDVHKEIINTSIVMREIFVGLQNWKQDPLLALAGFDILPELKQKYESINSMIENKLEADGISFDTKQLF